MEESLQNATDKKIFNKKLLCGKLLNNTSSTTTKFLSTTVSTSNINLENKTSNNKKSKVLLSQSTYDLTNKNKQSFTKRKWWFCKGFFY